jgi:hypothetical protein
MQALNSLKSMTPLPSLSHSLRMSVTFLLLNFFIPFPIYRLIYFWRESSVTIWRRLRFRFNLALWRLWGYSIHRRVLLRRNWLRIRCSLFCRCDLRPSSPLSYRFVIVWARRSSGIASFLLGRSIRRDWCRFAGRFWWVVRFGRRRVARRWGWRLVSWSELSVGYFWELGVID